MQQKRTTITCIICLLCAICILVSSTNAAQAIGGLLADPAGSEASNENVSTDEEAILNDDGLASIDPAARITNTWGNWEKTETSVTARNGNDWNLFAMTDIFATEGKDLVYEATFTRLDGTNCASLVFGVNSKEDPGAGWFGVNLRFDLGKAFLYSENIGSLGFDENARYATIGDKETYTLRVEASANGNIRAYLDGEKFADVVDTSYKGGYIGLLTFFGSYRFENMRYSISDPEVVEGAINPAAQITNTWGTWEKTETSVTAKNPNDWNLFAMTNIYAAPHQDMVYEATLTRLDGTNCASLVFGVANREDPGAGWFGVNLRFDLGKAFLYSERIGSLGFDENARYATIGDKETYTLRVEASADGTIKAFIDGQKFAEVVDTSYKGGYVGLLTFFGSYQFDNMRCVLSESEAEVVDAPINPVEQITNTWGNWASNHNSVIANNGNDWNLFAMTDIYAGPDQDLTYKATMTRLDGTNCASLVFGVNSKEDPGAGWFGVNLRFDLGKAFLYSENKGSLGFDENARYATIGDKETYTLRVEASANGNIKAYLDGVLFADVTDTGYSGGYIGLLTFFGSFRFENMKYSITDAKPAEGAINPEERITNTWGNWQTTSNSVTAYNGGDWNLFAMTDIYAGPDQDMVYEAALTRLDGTNCASLVFGVANREDPGAGWFGVNLRFDLGKAFLYSERIGSLGFDENARYATIGEKETYTLRVEASADGNIKAYIDGVLFADVVDTSYKGGYIGLLTFFGNYKFEKMSCVLTQSDADIVSAPINPAEQITNTWGNWTSNYNSVTANNGNDWNLFAMTDIYAGENQDLVYEATLTRLNGSNCASLVFGVNSKEDPGAGWFGVNLRFDLGKAFLYSENTGSLGFNENLRQTAIGEKDTYILRVHAYANGVIQVYLDDVMFASAVDTSYHGGYIGLLTFFGNYKFENMKYSITTAKETVFETEGETKYEVDSYRSCYTWANWVFNSDNSFTANNIGTANEFSMSNLYVEKNQNFYIEADVAVQGISAGIGFGISQVNDPIKGWYGIIVDKSAGCARVFSENKGTLSAASSMTVSLTREQLAAETLRLRIEVSAGGVLTAWLDGVMFARDYDSGWDGGYIGFNTFYANATFSNIKFSIWNQEKGLADLTVAEAPFTFDPATGAYVVEVPATKREETCPIAITAVPAEGYSVTVNGKNTQYAKVALTISRSVIEIVATHEETGKTALYYLIVKCSVMEQYRPGFHYTENDTWINDPNGLVYDATTNTYHMFYQYCERVNNNSYFYWGHAVSSDLVNWERKEPAIAPDQNGIIFSGSCVIDENNTSGLFDDSVPPASRLIAFFTYHQDNPSIGMAYSTDFGETWIKYGKVIANEDNIYGNHFRDPKVIYTNGKWLMITGGWTNVRLFSSTNLKNWKLDSEVYDYFGNPLQSECPDIFPLALDGDETNMKWVITTGGTSYIVGSLEMISGNFVFTSETPGYKMYNGATLWSNVGEMYATQSYYNDKLGRRILVSWMVDRTANAIDSKCWNGAESLPLETELITLNGMIVMRGYPVEEVESLHGKLEKEYTDLVLGSDSENPLTGIDLKTYDLQLQIEVGTAKNITLELCKGVDQSVVLKYDVINRVLTLDVTNAGQVVSYQASASVTVTDGILTLRILMDSSIMDIFAQEGIQSFHGFVFPEEGSTGLSLTVEGGEATVKSLKIWKMNAMQ